MNELQSNNQLGRDGYEARLFAQTRSLVFRLRTVYYAITILAIYGAAELTLWHLAWAEAAIDSRLTTIRRVRSEIEQLDVSIDNTLRSDSMGAGRNQQNLTINTGIQAFAQYLDEQGGRSLSSQAPIDSAVEIRNLQIIRGLECIRDAATLSLLAGMAEGGDRLLKPRNSVLDSICNARDSLSYVYASLMKQVDALRQKKLTEDVTVPFTYFTARDVDLPIVLVFLIVILVYYLKLTLAQFHVVLFRWTHLYKYEPDVWSFLSLQALCDLGSPFLSSTQGIHEFSSLRGDKRFKIFGGATYLTLLLWFLGSLCIAYIGSDILDLIVRYLSSSTLRHGTSLNFWSTFSARIGLLAACIMYLWFFGRNLIRAHANAVRGLDLLNTVMTGSDAPPPQTPPSRFHPAFTGGGTSMRIQESQ